MSEIDNTDCNHNWASTTNHELKPFSTIQLHQTSHKCKTICKTILSATSYIYWYSTFCFCFCCCCLSIKLLNGWSRTAKFWLPQMDNMHKNMILLIYACIKTLKYLWNINNVVHCNPWLYIALHASTLLSKHWLNCTCV